MQNPNNTSKFPLATITAMVLIAIIQAIALLKGLDGVILASGVLAIAGLAGYQARTNASKK